MAKLKFTQVLATNPRQKESVDEVCEPSSVPETSPSVSVTIGTKDTDKQGEDKLGSRKDNKASLGNSVDHAQAASVPKDQQKKTFAALFQDNRNPSKGMTLSKFDNLNGEVDISVEEMDSVETALGFTLLGYVAGGFPGIEALRRLSNSWNTPHKFHIHKSGWLLFRFDDFELKEKVLQGGPYLIFGRPLILKDMPPLFEFGACTHSEVPVWITLPGLPLDLWNARLLGKICSIVGEPICTDAMTSRKDRISYARVLVNVDLAKELVTEIKINLPNGKVREQYVSYESLPKYCTHCNMLGHATDFCRRNAKQVDEGNQGTTQVTSAVKPGSHQAGVSEQLEEAKTSKLPIAEGSSSKDLKANKQGKGNLGGLADSGRQNVVEGSGSSTGFVEGGPSSLPTKAVGLPGPMQKHMQSVEGNRGMSRVNKHKLDSEDAGSSDAGCKSDSEANQPSGVAKIGEEQPRARKGAQGLERPLEAIKDSRLFRHHQR
ncbi:hypothetical protein M9H77_00286 [Catharanthus roseus]|nr:hypothetical protein M9H77_00286 [Catharanthus roseus]